MTTVSNLGFGHTSFLQPATRAAAKAPHRARLNRIRATRMHGSLWRHTQQEDASHESHGLLARMFFGVIAALGLGSVVYGLWQTVALMSGSHLHDAVATFLH